MRVREIAPASVRRPPLYPPPAPSTCPELTLLQPTPHEGAFGGFLLPGTHLLRLLARLWPLGLYHPTRTPFPVSSLLITQFFRLVLCSRSPLLFLFLFRFQTGNSQCEKALWTNSRGRWSSRKRSNSTPRPSQTSAVTCLPLFFLSAASGVFLSVIICTFFRELRGSPLFFFPSFCDSFWIFKFLCLLTPFASSWGHSVRVALRGSSRLRRWLCGFGL